MANKKDPETPQKRFEDAFKEYKSHSSSFEAWQRFVYIAGRMLARSFGNDTSPFDDIADAAENASGVEKFSIMFNSIVEMLEENPFQDALGSMFMNLGIGNEAGGQFFTPYHLAKLTAKLAFDEHTFENAVSDKGFATFNEPSCGAGANVIGACDVMHERGIDWQRKALFVCQDISELTALMCYIQLSLIGAAAVVIVGDTLKIESRLALITPCLMVDDVWVLRHIRELSNEHRTVWR